MVASATDGREIVKDSSEPMSPCDRCGVSIAQKGTVSRANSQIKQESSGMGKLDSVSGCSQQVSMLDSHP